MGTVIDDNSDKEDQMAIGIVSELHPRGDQQLVGYSDIIETVTEENNSGRKDEIEIAVSESQSTNGDRQLVSYPDSDSDGEPCNSKEQPIFNDGFFEEIDFVLVSK